MRDYADEPSIYRLPYRMVSYEPLSPPTLYEHAQRCTDGDEYHDRSLCLEKPGLEIASCCRRRPGLLENCAHALADRHKLRGNPAGGEGIAKFGDLDRRRVDEHDPRAPRGRPSRVARTPSSSAMTDINRPR